MIFSLKILYFLFLPYLNVVLCVKTITVNDHTFHTTDEGTTDHTGVTTYSAHCTLQGSQVDVTLKVENKHGTHLPHEYRLLEPLQKQGGFEKIITYGTDNVGDLVLALEVEGVSCASLIEKGHDFPSQVVCQIGADLVEKYKYLHQVHKILYRSLNPEHIRLTKGYKVILTGFENAVHENEDSPPPVNVNTKSVKFLSYGELENIKSRKKAETEKKGSESEEPEEPEEIKYNDNADLQELLKNLAFLLRGGRVTWAHLSDDSVQGLIEWHAKFDNSAYCFCTAANDEPTNQVLQNLADQIFFGTQPFPYDKWSATLRKSGYGNVVYGFWTTTLINDRYEITENQGTDPSTGITTYNAIDKRDEGKQVKIQISGKVEKNEDPYMSFEIAAYDKIGAFDKEVPGFPRALCYTTYGDRDHIVLDWYDETLVELFKSSHPHTDKEIFRRQEQMIKHTGVMHAKKIIHRNIKPETIVTSANGETVKITGFGMSLNRDLPRESVDKKNFIKDPAFKSPHVLRGGEPRNIDDVYSSAMITLYFLEKGKLDWPNELSTAVHTPEDITRIAQLQEKYIHNMHHDHPMKSFLEYLIDKNNEEKDYTHWAKHFNNVADKSN